MSQSLKPLQSTLESILGRLAVLESKAGVTVAAAAAADTANGTHGHANPVSTDDETPASIQAYDTHMQTSLIPFVNACNSISGLSTTGTHIQQVWEGIKSIIILASKCKKPNDNNIQSALMPHLSPVQNAMSDIRTLKLDRKYDWHIKAIMEMLVCASWVITTAPPSPSSFVKETIGSSDFWCNKIRKEYKGKQQDKNEESVAMIAFCDTMKALILDLSNYVKEYHLSGLMWNPHGIDIADYKTSSQSSSTTTSTTTTTSTSARKSTITSTPSPPSGADIMKELASKRTTDGSSAATGLKKVTREQQTWRKEYKHNQQNATSSSNTTTQNVTVRPSSIKSTSSSTTVTTVKKTPVCRFQSLGSKWIVENQSKTTNPNGLCTVEIQNPKEQVYVYKCEEATIQIKGKLKSVILDSCNKTNLVFDSAISSCEVVNCKRVQIQSTGICPSFSIDKTDGCLVYLSSDAVGVTNFVTSKSTEMNVSWPDEKSGEQKEAPIPEQFVHRLKGGVVTSEVSDLYH